MPNLLGHEIADDWPERSTRFWMDRTMPKFWPSRPSLFWSKVFEILRRYYARGVWRVSDVAIEGLEATFERFGPNDGLVVAPNHSHEADAHIRQLYEREHAAVFGTTDAVLSGRLKLCRTAKDLDAAITHYNKCRDAGEITMDEAVQKGSEIRDSQRRRRAAAKYN